MFAKPRAITVIRRLLLPGARPFSGGDKAAPPPMQPLPAEYRQLDNLDFMTAAKILFTEPPKKKKFGFDFHLVQFFFACMPSLAVYLVAQYARYEIRRMEAEVEKKKQAEEEEKAKEAELDAEEERTELSKVMVRLDALEGAVKEIVDDKKKTSESNSSNNQKAGSNNESISVDKDSMPNSKPKEGELAVHRKKETTSSSTPTASIAEEDKKRFSGIGKEDASVGQSK